MKTYKSYRHESNPKEKEIHDKFIEEFSDKTLSGVIFGWANDSQTYPKEYLTEREEDICLSLIQWLGSPVGQGFLRDCGFKL